MSAAAPRRWRRPPLLIKNDRTRRLIYGGALIYLVLAFASVEVDPARIAAGLERGWRFVQGFLTPDFRAGPTISAAAWSRA